MPYISAKFYLKYKSNNDSNKQTDGPVQMKTEWIFYAHMQTFFFYRGPRRFHQVGLFLQLMKSVNISESQKKKVDHNSSLDIWWSADETFIMW